MRNSRPDVVLIDLVMPHMDGHQLIAEMNRDKQLADIPKFIVSAQDPVGQPLITRSLAVTRGGGVPVPRLLAMIQACIASLSPQTSDSQLESLQEKQMSG